LVRLYTSKLHHLVLTQLLRQFISLLLVQQAELGIAFSFLRLARQLHLPILNAAMGVIMAYQHELDNIAIGVKARKLLFKLLRENPELEEIMVHAENETEAIHGMRTWLDKLLDASPAAKNYYGGNGKAADLSWSDYALLRLLDYIDHAGREFVDLNLHGQLAISNPLKLIWLGTRFGTGGAKPFFYEDMLHLFRQLRGAEKRQLPDMAQLQQWMDRYPSGLDPRIIKLREENRDRILSIFIEKIDEGEINDSRYRFNGDENRAEKLALAREWWRESVFHLRFAVRSPDLLNELLGYSLDPDTMDILYRAERRGIPFFVNPYYLSLLHVRVPYFAIGADLAIRDYILYSRQLVEEFGNINAWEKEDKVEPGVPNAAGWILPSHHNVHRRYPDVAILIPATMGRACAGLCSSCQRMYDFQNGHLNFNLNKLKPDEKWPDMLRRLMDYFENDAQLRDILITGGDALMSSNASLKRILDDVLAMASRKRQANSERPEGEKYAEIVRIRLGTRLPVYLPQRIDEELIDVLRQCREAGEGIGIRQFVIQTHFESPMEITPEVASGIEQLRQAGWLVSNQHVYTAAASRRGHNAKLRQTLNDIGILPYYTFSVKGYMENYHNFAPNARAVQEVMEEKRFGQIRNADLRSSADNPGEISTAELRQELQRPFLATDRSVLNLPGVGKSLSFRVIGITRYGRRILEFDHDPGRDHSPIITSMGKVVIIEAKSIAEYLAQLEEMGEERDDYISVYGYSLGETEARMPVFSYPPYTYKITEKMTNLELNGYKRSTTA
jgi:lysine 2,3-aminomutase